MTSYKPHIKVYGSVEELSEIKELAAKSGMSHSQFCRRILSGRKVKQISDTELMKALAEINNSLIDYGSTLKLLAINEKKSAYFSKHNINHVVSSTLDAHKQIKKLMKDISEHFS